MPNKRHLKTIYNRSKLLFNSLNGVKEIEFIYPTGLKWACKKCGACCIDPKGRERRILLLTSDLERLIQGKLLLNDCTKLIGDQKPFKAEMKKINGSCVLLTEDGCKHYSFRALLCRMYPFWVERQDALLIVRHDDNCLGFDSGEPVTENIFRKLMTDAIGAMEL